MTLTTEKLAELKRLYAAMTNCDIYGEDGAAKGVMVPQSLLDQFESALAERALQPEEGGAQMHADEPEIRASAEKSAVFAQPEDGQALPDAYLFTCRTKRAELKQFASVYENAHWPVDQWKSYKVEPLYTAPQLALPAGPVPEGWKLVPIEPTKEMLKAANNAYEEDAFGGKGAWPSDIYASMLKAVPKHFIFSPAVAQPVPAGPVPHKMVALLEEICSGEAVVSTEAVRQIIYQFDQSFDESPAVAQPQFTAEEIAKMKAHTRQDVAMRNAWLDFNKSLDSELSPAVAQPVADEREGVKFFQYEAFTEATRQVKAVSDDLQESFARERAERKKGAQ